MLYTINMILFIFKNNEVISIPITSFLMATPHNSAKVGDFAETVLMCGDPLRAKLIADNYLENAKQVNSVRGMLGFTGTYKGKPLSVMGHGMGIPSISIYAEELYNVYKVKTIIRVGTCGTVDPNVHVRDVCIVTSSGTDSNVNRMRLLGHDFPATANFEVVSALVESAKALNIPTQVGKAYSTDIFYSKEQGLNEALAQYHFIAVEMESAGLFPIADYYGARAGCICTVSDHIITHESATPEERQTSFQNMIKIALEATLKL